MPRGPEFEALLKRHEEVPAGPQRALAERSLAFLWYARAAAAGFAPAMNNLGAMYQFGLMGGRDRMQAMMWYQRAAAANNPVARFNVMVIGKRTGSGGCAEDEVMAMMAGLSAPAADIEDEILDHTRYRGRTAPGMIRGLIRAQNAAAQVEPGKGTVLDTLSIVAAMRRYDLDENPQDFDDAEEVAAAAASPVRGTCDDGHRRDVSSDDRRKPERLRDMQDASDRARTAQLRRRW